MPIVIKLNGKETELPEGMTVGQLLDSRKIRREMVTVQVNGAIIDRSHFDTTALKDGDEVEFLYYMGGGARVTAGSAQGATRTPFPPLTPICGKPSSNKGAKGQCR